MHWAGEYAFGIAGAAFRGAAADNAPHAHATLQVVASHVEPAVMERPGRPTATGTHLLVRPGVVHTLRPVSFVTLLFLQPETEAARRLLDIVPLGEIVDLPDSLRAQLAPDVPLADVLAAFDQDIAVSIDERVKKALAYLVDATGPRTIARAATDVGLSPSRLRALAQAQFGVPLTAWLAWRRLERAGKAIAAGASLAEAAFDAGFADQAHLSRTTRQVFGITPRVGGGVVSGQAIPSRSV